MLQDFLLEYERELPIPLSEELNSYVFALVTVLTMNPDRILWGCALHDTVNGDIAGLLALRNIWLWREQ